MSFGILSNCGGQPPTKSWGKATTSASLSEPRKSSWSEPRKSTPTFIRSLSETRKWSRISSQVEVNIERNTVICQLLWTCRLNNVLPPDCTNVDMRYGQCNVLMESWRTNLESDYSLCTPLTCTPADVSTWSARRIPRPVRRQRSCRSPVHVHAHARCAPDDYYAVTAASVPLHCTRRSRHRCYGVNPLSHIKP